MGLQRFRNSRTDNEIRAGLDSVQLGLGIYKSVPSSGINIVKVTDTGHTYSRYRELANILKIKNWVDGDRPIKGKEYIVKGIHKHLKRSPIVVHIQDPETGQGYLIEDKGIYPVYISESEFNV